MTAAKKKQQSEFLEPDGSRDIIVAVGLQSEGATYRMHPTSAARVRKEFPDVHVAPTVYVGYTTKSDFEALHGPMWPQIVILLTGVDENKLLKKFQRLLLWDPATGSQWNSIDGTLKKIN